MGLQELEQNDSICLQETTRRNRRLNDRQIPTYVYPVRVDLVGR
jgi:hypothetical protein